MPYGCLSSHIFTDPDQYWSATPHADGLFSVLSRGVFHAQLTTLQIGQLVLQSGRDTLARVASTGMPGKRVGILVWPPKPCSSVVRGVQIRPGEVMYFGVGMQSHHRTSGPTEYVAMSLDEADLARAVGDMAGRDVDVVGGQVLRPPDHSLARLQAVLLSAIEVVQTTPEVLSSQPAAKSLEQALLGQMIECLQLGDARDDHVPPSRHVVLAKRLEETIEANLGNPLSIGELSRMVGVPERRLRKLSQEQWGISPTRFLLFRRLHLARYALLRADQDSATVTKIALDMGFWELGRFAAIYKWLFGESPSATLRRRFEVESVNAPSRIDLGPNLHSVRTKLDRMTAILGRT